MKQYKFLLYWYLIYRQAKCENKKPFGYITSQELWFVWHRMPSVSVPTLFKNAYIYIYIQGVSRL